MYLKNVHYLITTSQPEKFPPLHLRDVIIVGRSNVGKSTFINLLANNKKMAKTSKIPGKTKALSFFEVNKKFYLVDLPGYGYAKTSHKNIYAFSKMIENYLKIRKNNIQLAILLLDIRRNLNLQDRTLIDYFLKEKLDFVILGTKADKAKQSDIFAFKKMIREEFNCDVLLFSAKKRTGLVPVFKIFTDLSN